MILTLCTFATAALAQEKGFVFYEVSEAYFNTENMTFDLLNKNIDIAPFGIEPGSWISENTNTDTSYFLVTEGDHRMDVMIAVGATRKTDSTDLYRLAYRDSTGVIRFPSIEIQTIVDGVIVAPRYLIEKPNVCVYKELLTADHPQNHKKYYLFSVYIYESVMFQLVCTLIEKKE